MTRRRQTTQLVPVGPAHRRMWRSFWRRCSCGLAAPCVDVLAPATPLPFPPRGASRVLSPSPPAPVTERRYSYDDILMRPGKTGSDPTFLSRCRPGGSHSPSRRPQRPPGGSPRPRHNIPVPPSRGPHFTKSLRTIGGGRRRPTAADGGRAPAASRSHSSAPPATGSAAGRPAMAYRHINLHHG